MNRPVAAAQIALAMLFATPVVASWDDGDAGSPALRVFGASDYGESGPNRCLIKDRRGRLYVANDTVLEYDGRVWSRIAINDAYEIRYLALDEANRVWVAGKGELGYLDETSEGTRAFHSLNAYLPPEGRTNDPWYVFRLRGRTLFVMAGSLLIWDGHRFEYRAFPNPHRLFAFPFRGGVGISQIGTGLWLWNGETIERVPLPEIEEYVVNWSVRGADGAELFGTSNGIARVADGKVTWLEGDADRFQVRAGTTDCVQLPDGNICVGSVKNGLLIIQPDGQLLRTIDRRDGLPSVECIGLLLDDENGLWVATNRNVLRMDSRNAETNLGFLRNSNVLDTKLAAKLVVRDGESVVVLGDESAYKPRAQDDDRTILESIPSSASLYNDVATTPDGKLLLGRLGGIRWSAPDGHIAALATHECFRLLPTGPRSPIVIAAESRTLAELETSPTLRLREPPLAELPDHASDLALDHHGILWATTARNGLFSLRYPKPAGANEPPRNLQRGTDLPADFDNPLLFVLNGETFAYNARAAFRLTARRGDTPPVQILAGTHLLTVERSGENDVWAINAPPQSAPQLIRIRRNGGDLQATAMECRSLPTIGRPLTIARDNAKKNLWIGGTTGLLRVELASIVAERLPSPPAILRPNWRTEDSVTGLPLQGGARVAFHKEATLSFDVRDSRAPLDGVGRVEARLVGADAAWTKAELVRSYSGLREGHYEFQARALDLAGKPGPIASYVFTIDPPWHRSGFAYTVYIAGAIGCAYVAVRLWTRRVARLNVQLEALVTTRTEELTRAVSARSAFLANMGHEIRNPLNGVVGLVESLRSDGLSPAQKPVVDRLGSCAAQLVSVVEDVMEYARVDAGRVTLRTRAFALREPVDSAIDVFRAAAPESEIVLEAEAPDLEARVAGDPDRIRQILVNYLANALKFGGGSKVTVRIRREDEKHFFAVTDHGPGISEEEQSRLFVRFSRGSLAHEKAIPGTGIGLAACKAYAEAMGGEVGVESRLGHGATFFLRLPLPRATEDNSAPAAAPPDIMVGRTALVVDDHEFNRVVLTDLLGRMGAANTMSAPDIAAARSAFAARVPDVVFVDFDLAGVTGADFAQWVRNEAPAGRDVPIVATSAFEVDEVRQRCEQAGMDGFLVKPVTPQKIAAAIARIEVLRSGGIANEILPAAGTPAPVHPLDLLSEGDPKRRQELEHSAWREILVEGVEALRGLRRGSLPEAAQRSHRLVSAAHMLGLKDVVVNARELNRAARAGEDAAANAAARRLRRSITAARRQFKG